MKKIKCLLEISTLLLTLGAVACGDNTSSISSILPSDTSSITETSVAYDVNYPTEIPLLGEDSIQIHYSRRDKKFAPWCLWLWNADGGEGKIYNFNYMDQYGVVASYPLSEFGENLSSGQLGFIVRKTDSWTKDTEDDRFMDFSNLEKDKNGVYHIYLSQGDKNIYTNPDKQLLDSIVYAKFITSDTIEFKTNKVISKYEVYAGDEQLCNTNVEGMDKITFRLKEDASITTNYSIKVTFKDTQKVLESPISIRALYSTASFESTYNYDGELGALYTATGTTFKVWSPVSTKMLLRIYDNGTPTSVDATKGSDAYQEHEMIKGEKGVFSYYAEGDLSGKYYTYVTYNFNNPEGKEVVDPYAKSAGVNGQRGMVVDFSKTNPEGWESTQVHAYDRKQLAVWETHVCDVTSSSTWTGKEENRKKFLGLSESGTTYKNGDVTVKTGFDHIKELGVNAVQLVPIFDQDNDETNPTFNWGYNPLNYNVLEGSYSSNPYDGYTRIKEFKQVVQEYNKAGINIIMDVVYNHVAGLTSSNFHALMPGYYFRYNDNDAPYNGSGCGNETASDMKMFRKFMIDSASFWAKEYKLGGFRFDLMGLHDLSTMAELTAKVKQINPTIAIYGEPWTGGTSGLSSIKQAVQANGNGFQGYGQFNDRMRDALIRGGLSGADARGWITNPDVAGVGDAKIIIEGVKGYTSDLSFSISDPNKTVNYVTCHDNYTLYDRIIASGTTDPEVAKKMNVLANSVVFTSQGTTFMLAGDEMLRTKGGNNNSYNASYEVNELNYANKVQHLDAFKSYQKLIALKTGSTGLHLNGTDSGKMDIKYHDNGATIQFKIQDESKEYIITHTSGVGSTSKFNLTGYNVYLDTLNIYKENDALTSYTPQKYQTVIAYKNK